jgi:hypothetical protein
VTLTRIGAVFSLEPPLAPPGQLFRELERLFPELFA